MSSEESIQDAILSTILDDDRNVDDHFSDRTCETRKPTDRVVLCSRSPPLSIDFRFIRRSIRTVFCRFLQTKGVVVRSVVSFVHVVLCRFVMTDVLLCTAARELFVNALAPYKG